MSRIKDLWVKLGLKADDFTKGLNKASSSTKSFSNQAGKMIGSVAAKFASLATAVALVGRAIKDTISNVAGFERSNSVLASVLGKTKAEIKGLTDAARELAKTTEFTASQVSQLQISLARLGFNDSQILDMQEAVVKFASAVGTDAASAADFTGAALRAFGLDAKDTADLLDVMAASTAKSALDFSKLSTAIGIVAPTARTFGLSAADTAALLGQLANNGLDASMAATALRNIMLKLADPASALNKYVKEPIRDLPSLIKLFKQLKNEGADLGKMFELTDVRAVTAFSAFIDGVDSVSALREELGKCSGTLNTMYEEVTGNLVGSVNKLKSEWEELTLTFSESAGVLKTVVDWLGKLVAKISDLQRTSQTGNIGDKTKEDQKNLINRFTGIGDSLGRDEMLRQFTAWENDAEAAYDRAIDAYNDHKSRKNKKAMMEAGDYVMNLSDIKTTITNYQPNANPVNKAVEGVGAAGSDALEEPVKKATEWKDILARIKEETNAIGEELQALAEEEAYNAEINDRVYQQFRDAHNLPPIQVIDQDIIHNADMGFQKWAEDLRRVEEEARKLQRAFDFLDELTLGSIQADLDAQQDAINKSLTGFGGMLEENAFEIGDLVSGVLTSAVSGFSDAMDTMFESLFAAEELDSTELMTALLTPLCDTAKQMGEVMMTMAAGMIAVESSIENPYLLLAAGAALVAIGAAGKAALSSIAKGNSTSTTTTSTVMSGATTSSAELTVYVKGTIKGSDIVISGQNTMNEWNK